MPICSNCLMELDESVLCKNWKNRCKECVNKYHREDYALRRKDYYTEYYKDTVLVRRNTIREAKKPDRERKRELRRQKKLDWQKSQEGRQYYQEWRKRNKQKRSAYQKKYVTQKDNVRFGARLRTLVYVSLKKQTARKVCKTEELIGCAVSDLREHLQTLFHPGMSWQNHGRHGWHIDHIIPCSYFDLSDPAQQKICFHYTNLQPLWAKDNIAKSNKYVA
jgi:hypothetical protein